MRWYCTYCDRNYLTRMLALRESLVRNERQAFTLFVVCLDELTRVILHHLDFREIRTIGLHEVERENTPLQAARSSRSLVEYYWTLTPTVILYIFEHVPAIDRITYLDSDLYFFNDPDPMFTEHAAPVLIHGHRFAKKYKNLEAFGIYNVGLLSFMRCEASSVIIKEWQQQCNEWCFAHVEDGKFGDQLYLNDWPQKYEDVHVLAHPGVGIAPWNQNDVILNLDDRGMLMSDGAPLIFYHFHALDVLETSLFVPSKLLHYHFELPVLLYCYLPYVMSLQNEFFRIQSLLPEFQSGMARLPDILPHTLLATASTARILAESITGCDCTNIGNGWSVCRQPSETGTAHLADPAKP